MPTYDYECKICGHNFEKFQNMTDPALKECPECSGEVRKKINSGHGIIFKGSGFYETDYKRKPQNCAKADKCGKKCDLAE